ncbi:TlpA family protein disulfide reductase [Wenyingzhuangia sp. IMCC45467]
MKKKILFSLMLGLLFINSFAQKTIENPDFELTKTGMFNISKIEISDTETKIHIHHTSIPNWWVYYKDDVYIEDCDTGKKYNIIKVENVKFKEKIWMTDSGENNTVAIFPPLDKGVKNINYNNLIFNISLTEQKVCKKNKVPKKITKWFKKELAKVKSEPIKEYNSPNFFNKKNAKLIGYIKGYDSRLGFETGIIFMENEITREDYPIVIQIHKDGRFEADIPLIHPKYIYFNMNKANINIYIEPGQTLVTVLDWNEFLIADRFRNNRHVFKNIEFLGPLAQVNYDLLQYDKNDFDYKLFNKQKKEITPKEFKKLQEKNHQKNTIRLIKHLATHNLSDKSATLLKNKNILDNATLMFNFVMNRDYYAKKDTLNKVLKAPVETKYYDFLNKIDLNNQSLLVDNRFSEFINRFEYSKPLNVKPKKTEITFNKTFLDYIKDNKIEISPAYKNLLETFENLSDDSKNEFHQKNQKLFEEYKTKYRKEFDTYVQKNRDENWFYSSIKRIQLKDSVLTNVLKLDENFINEITKIRSLKFNIGTMKKSEYAYKYWEELKKDIKNPFLIQEGSRMVYKKFPLTSENSSKTTKLPTGKATDIFKAIVDKHQGKILFIDFWATSCGPCVSGIKRMKETRKKHENNPNFDFVFITDERHSPKKNYDKFVKEQELKNIYRLSTDDYNYLRQLFKFNGIPRYVVIDKKGDIIDDDFSMHKFDYLLESIIENHK